jgi:hypothetical protein
MSPRHRRPSSLTATWEQVLRYQIRFREENPGMPWSNNSEARIAVEDSLFFRHLWSRYPAVPQTDTPRQGPPERFSPRRVWA